MDISDIITIANRTKMTADAEEMVSRETQNVIKLEEQAYSEQQETLQMEAQGDQLQQYTNKKLIAIREQRNALEEGIERLTATEGRTGDDQIVLPDMHAKAAQEVRQINEDINTAHNRANLKILIPENNLEGSEARYARAEKEAQVFRAFSELYERQAHDVAIEAKNFEAALVAAYADRDRFAASLKQELQNAADLRNRIEKNQVEYEATNSKLLNAMEQLERERREAQRNIDEEHALREAAETRVAQLEAATLREPGHTALLERAEVAETKLIEQNKLLKNMESDIDRLTLQLFESQQKLEECEKKIEEMTIANQKAASEVDEANKALNEMRESGEKQLRNLETVISQKDADLNCKAEDIARLLREAKLAAEATVRVEEELRVAHAVAHAAADHERALQLRITELEVALKDKTNALEAANFGRTLASDKPEDIDRCYVALERGDSITEPLLTRGEKAMLAKSGREQPSGEVHSSTRKRVFMKNRLSTRKGKPNQAILENN